MFWFLALAMVVVVAAVTLAVVGGGEGEVLPEAGPERTVDPLPLSRPVGRADLEQLRLPLAPRGYRMSDVDDVLDRLGAELAERDARIAELEAALAGAQATATGSGDLFDKPGAPPPPAPEETPAAPAREDDRDGVDGRDGGDHRHGGAGAAGGRTGADPATEPEGGR
ncbi:DivIVA domain-containing protein [Streptomyces sp. LP05-1]|uniref:DivIVA domain-containing protein n=1 Tax=Streptomyces pyxinae TaxID=2970734 RepID=A0ABT2CAU2_9ACTN|nr:DivIVA domain-containing protein [Streptomyces sp. LP05-1]MCS0634440.1 DivIVA domain-containing protein [Streptomyces sp. LP05-1]